MEQSPQPRCIKWCVTVERLVGTGTSPVRKPPLQDTTRLPGVVFPCTGTATAVSKWLPYRTAGACASVHPSLLNHRAGLCMPVDNDAIRGSGLAPGWRNSLPEFRPPASLLECLRDELDKEKGAGPRWAACQRRTQLRCPGSARFSSTCAAAPAACG